MTKGHLWPAQTAHMKGPHWKVPLLYQLSVELTVHSPAVVDTSPI